MAGKTWSEEEEHYFWTHVVPFSRRRRGIHLVNPELTFRQLGERMQKVFGGPNGDEARRNYSALCLEEHFYLNIEAQRPSRHAYKYFLGYRALAAKYPGLPEKTSRAAHRTNNDVEHTHPSCEPGAEHDWEIGGDENAAKREAILALARVAPDNATPGRVKRPRHAAAAADQSGPRKTARTEGPGAGAAGEPAAGGSAGRVARLSTTPFFDEDSASTMVGDTTGESIGGTAEDARDTIEDATGETAGESVDARAQVAVETTTTTETAGAESNSGVENTEAGPLAPGPDDIPGLGSEAVVSPTEDATPDLASTARLISEAALERMRPGLP